MKIPTTLHLHVGQPKTGSTTLQKALLRRHPDIFYLGRYVPTKVQGNCLSEEIYQLLRPLLWDISAPLDVDQSRQQLARISAAADATGKVWVGSWEGLIQRPPAMIREMIQRLQAFFGGCRILLTLRNPLTRIPSEYLENLKSHFIQGLNPWMGKLPYIDIQQWIHRASKGEYLANMLSYGTSVQEAVRILGVDQVGVFLFEELCQDPARYYSKIFSFLSIDPECGMALTQNEHLHLRVTQGGIDFLKQLNCSPFQCFFSEACAKEISQSHLDQEIGGIACCAGDSATSVGRRSCGRNVSGASLDGRDLWTGTCRAGCPMELSAMSAATLTHERRD
jgi:hypothetical protein